LKSQFEVSFDDRTFQHGQEVDRQLLESGSDSAAHFQPANALFNHRPTPVRVFVEAASTRLFGCGGTE